MSQVTNTLRDTFNRSYKVNLPVGVEVQKNVFGTFVMITEQKGGNGAKFEMSFEELPFFDATMGMRFKLPNGNSFSKLRFVNKTGEPMDIEFFAGSIEAEDFRLSILRGRAVRMTKAETISTAFSASIPSLGEIDLSNEIAFPPPNELYVRASTTIFNRDLSTDLEILNPSDDVIGTVFPKTGYLRESTEAVKIQNNSGSPVLVTGEQLWTIFTN